MEYEDNGHKVVVGFIAGLLIGGLLIWAMTPMCPDEYEDSSSAPKQATEMSLKEKTIDACLAKGGIPILDDYEKLIDCKGI